MDRQDITDTLIAEQGTLFSEEIGANIARDTPQELFHWLEGACLLAGRINMELAIEAAIALRDAKLHKIEEILAIDFWDMVKVLRDNGYKRYDTVTTDYLRETAEMVRADYGDDIRGMRGDTAGATLANVKKAKGVGDVGAAIFAREVQLVWDELYPMADGPALGAAERLGLPTEAQALVDLAGSRERFVRLMAALTRTALREAPEAVEDAAG